MNLQRRNPTQVIEDEPIIIKDYISQICLRVQKVRRDMIETLDLRFKIGDTV